jgi:hypothetical protein
MKAEIARIKSERAAQLEQDAKDLAEWAFCKLLILKDGGAATRTPDLGVMNPSL